MLGLILSTIAFFVAAFFFNRYLDEQGIETGLTRKVLVGTLATVVALGVSWVVGKFDGDDESARSKQALTSVLKGGDPAQAIKDLSGIK